MKSEDLMIGDWVLINGIPRKIQAVDDIDNEIMADDELYTFVEDRYHSEDRVEPIPLTPEILEKNGFEFGYTASEEDFCSATGCGYPEDKGWCYDEGAGEIKIIFPNETDGGLIRLDDQCIDKHLELVFVTPIMVHELQHALKLCGINKEIVL